MATLAQLYTRIILDTNRDDMGTGGALEQAKIDAVADAIEEYSGQQFWFNRASGSGNTVASTATIAIPSGIRYPSTVVYNGSPLQRASLSSIEWRTDTGIPKRWAENEDAIQLWPIPNAVYAISVYGLADVGAPSPASSSNIWTTEAYKLILGAAKKALYRGPLRDLEGASLAANEEKEALDSIRAETRRRARSNLGTDLPTREHFNIMTG